MKFHKGITQARLKELLAYDPLTGVFTRLKKTNRNKVIGSEAGSVNAEGYVLIGVDGARYMAHRLAWLYVFGSLPTKLIDHINHDKSDNRIENLREVTQSENLQNQVSPRKTTKSGFLGVSWDGANKKWMAVIKTNRKLKNLGRFDTPEQAHQKYLAAKRELHPFNTL